MTDAAPEPPAKSPRASAPRSRALRLVALSVGGCAAVLMLLLAFSQPRPVHPGVLAQCVTGEGAALLKRGGVAFEADLDGHTYVGTTDNVVDFSVRLIGSWEPEVLLLMRDILTRVYDGKGVVLDVGANTGVHSIYASSYAASVHAVEPWPPVLQRMRAMLEKNAITNVVVHPVGYADKPGSLPFFVPPDSNLGAGSFSANSIATPGSTIDLPLVRGDDDLREAGVERIDLMKIDIQGYEKPAMEGMRQILARSRPFVVMELLISEEEDLGFFSEAELRAAFPPDYTFFSIGEVSRQGLTVHLPGDYGFYCWDAHSRYKLAPHAMRFDDDDTHGNILGVPDERVEAFRAAFPESPAH